MDFLGKILVPILLRRESEDFHQLDYLHSIVAHKGQSEIKRFKFNVYSILIDT